MIIQTGKLMQITINPEYDRLIPNMSQEDYDNLKNSIKKNGLWVTILTNPQGVILDGHNRYDICKELGIDPRFAIRKFENNLLEKKFVIECNLYRRHLNDFQKSELGIPLLEIEKELAKQRELSGKTLVPNGTRGRATDIVSKNIGVSRNTFERAKKIIEEAPEDLKQEVREGRKTITTAYIQINNADKVKIQESLPLPKDKYQLIYCDPPWFYGNFHNSYYGTGKTAAELYTVMKADALKDLKVSEISHDDSILLMWVTYPCLEEGLDLIKAWGFQYKTVAFTWAKKNKSGNGYFMGLGNYTRANSEICLLAVKGKGLTVNSHSVLQICDAPLTKHSEKPIEIRERIVELFGNVKRIELFARTKSKGWESWGNEI